MTLERRRRAEKMVANLRWIALVAAALLLEDRATATAFVIGASFVFAYNLLISLVCSSPTAYARTRPWLGHAARVCDIVIITAAVPMFSNEWGSFRLLYVPVIIGASMVEGSVAGFVMAVVAMGASAGIGRAVLPAASPEYAAYDILANLMLFALAAVFGGYLAREAEREETNRLNVRRLAIFRDMGAALSNPSNIDHIAHLLASVAVELTGIRRCVVTVQNYESGAFEVRSIRGYRSEELGDGGIPRELEAGRRSAAVHDIPLVAQSEVLGTLHLAPSGKEERTSEDELEFLATLATQAATGIRNARLAAEVQRRAETDSLTGLANRWTLNAKADTEVKRARRYGHALSVCLCDLDNFKEVNDTHGHVAADRLLTSIARALENTLRPGDVCARYGGDEFVALLVNCGRDQAVRAAERIARIVQDVSRSELGGEPAVQLGISVGVSTFPDDAQDFEGLLRCADDRLLSAKRLGKGRIVTESEAA